MNKCKHSWFVSRWETGSEFLDASGFTCSKCLKNIQWIFDLGGWCELTDNGYKRYKNTELKKK